MDILIEKSSEKLTTIFPGLLRFKNYQESGNVHLIIFDRKADPITPLLYDFYYQSIIYDLLDIDNDTNIVEYKINKKNDQQETKKAQISDEGDEVFIKYRYKHIAESLEGIPNDFQNLVNTNSTAQMGKCNAEDLDLDKMQQIIKDMPQYNELLATGIDDSGKKLQSQKIVKQLKEILEKREISGIDKLRVALSAYIAIDLCEADRKTIISCFTDQEGKALLNLSWFGITFTDSKKNKNVSEIRKLDEKILKRIIRR
ncbi:sec1 family protein, putative [Ichthyophthirius multifiliis]|uniref:Sec1 family protein, putative n=1 Tax=Ichthyophthirius multifiliis TaxID=5932 RepID=G0QV08_ICHMU|nr:sec1 family protein, putative [Ichthyophthirius multifiliis]EGR30950.1 sec1 family protein, putative [Ichthyophthirius multifiliis]|eukprot:XP_004032537.1 sec1 family protein, putative [Ichthyophthirius multifiliis]